MRDRGFNINQMLLRIMYLLFQVICTDLPG